MNQQQSFKLFLTALGGFILCFGVLERCQERPEIAWNGLWEKMLFTDGDRYEGPLWSGAGPGASGVFLTASVGLDAAKHTQKHNSRVVWLRHVHVVTVKPVSSTCLYYSSSQASKSSRKHFRTV